MRKVSSTGSARRGAAESKFAADTIPPISLELGGKRALIVFNDADVDLPVSCTVDGSFFNQGEACVAASRLLVQCGVHDVFIEKLAAALHQENVEEYTRLGVAEGALINAQPPKLTDPALANRFFIQPTLFTNVNKENPARKAARKAAKKERKTLAEIAATASQSEANITDFPAQCRLNVERCKGMLEQSEILFEEDGAAVAISMKDIKKQKKAAEKAEASNTSGEIEGLRKRKEIK